MSYLLLLDMMAQPKIFRKIDIHAAYYLVKTKSGNEFKIAFRCQYGQYEYTVMLFGLANAPSIFMRLVNSIFHEHLGITSNVFLDDIAVFSKDEIPHASHVRQILTRLTARLS